MLSLLAVRDSYSAHNTVELPILKPHSSISKVTPSSQARIYLSKPLALTNFAIWSLHVLSVYVSQTSYNDINSCVHSTTASISTLLSASQSTSFCILACMPCPPRAFPSVWRALFIPAALTCEPIGFRTTAKNIAVMAMTCGAQGCGMGGGELVASSSRR